MASSTSTEPPNTNNHAVIVSSSRYWFNYRHVVNALSFYQLCKSNGIPDENIILMLADDLPSNARNPHKNGMYANGVDPEKTLYDHSTEIDYRGEDVTVDNLVKALLGRQGEPTGVLGKAPSGNRRQLQTDENSNILIYLTGHGGDQFFKFQDIEEITSEEIASVLEEMHRRKRYKEVLLVADTCQAFTLGDHITAPNVMVIGSSLRGESSYAHHSDQKLGLSVIERYTHGFINFVNAKKNGIQKEAGNLTIQEAMVDPYPFYSQRAHVGFRHDLMKRRHVNDTRLSDFLANNEPTVDTILLTRREKETSSVQAWPGTRTESRQIPSTILPQARLLHVEKVSSFAQLEKTLDQALPVYNPSDGLFLALVVAMISVVLLLSRPK